MDNLDIDVALKEIRDNFGEGSQEGVKESFRICQNNFGYLSKENKDKIGQLFGIKANVLDTILKFMPSVKESVVEYEIVCCSGSRCSKNGSFDVIKTIKEGLSIKLGEVSGDGKIRLDTQNCFKKCNVGPNVIVNGHLHSQMDKEKALELVRDIKSRT